MTNFNDYKMNVENIQAICKKLKAVTEDVKWGNDLVFSVGGKMFCVVGLEQAPPTASFKVKDEEFDEMCSRDGFKPAPYVAKYKWVWMDNINRLNKKEWEQFTRQSYNLVKAKLPQKVRKQLDLG
jgi:predicted DNA-binding protein (MmcQ/YjbR family)